MPLKELSAKSEVHSIEGELIFLLINILDT